MKYEQFSVRIIFFLFYFLFDCKESSMMVRTATNLPPGLISSCSGLALCASLGVELEVPFLVGVGALLGVPVLPVVGIVVSIWVVGVFSSTVQENM